MIDLYVSLTRKRSQLHTCTVHQGPPEDPYLSLEAVEHLDRLLVNLHATMEGVGNRLRSGDARSGLQEVAMQLVPAASSIAQSLPQNSPIANGTGRN